MIWNICNDEIFFSCVLSYSKTNQMHNERKTKLNFFDLSTLLFLGNEGGNRVRERSKKTSKRSTKFNLLPVNPNHKPPNIEDSRLLREFAQLLREHKGARV